MAGAASIDDARRFLALLARPGDVFELRGLVKVNGQQHVTSGFYDDLDALAKEAVRRSGQDTGVYVTLNPALPALLARAPKNRTRRAGSGDTTGDRDVRARRSLLIDIDPVRPAGISSTNEEHDAALELAKRVRTDLAAAGWPEPIYADSGNGGHLIYAVDLPVDDGGLVKRVLEQLHKSYSTPALKVDEKVFNAARISKIYGTLTKKGENTADRPHRVARIIEAPSELAIVSREQLEAFAPAAATSGKNPNGSRRDRLHYEGPEFDLEAWIATHIPDAKEKEWAEGRLWLLPTCPFSTEHDRKEAYISQAHGKGIVAGCKHDSCVWEWAELRAMCDEEYRKRKERYANGNGSISHREPPHEVLYEDADYDRIVAQEKDQSTSESQPTPAQRKPIALRGPQLPGLVLERAKDPWISLTLGDEELMRVRVGATVVLIGGSGSGKSSLMANLMMHHARNVGPAIVLSIELPADELAARMIGIQCDASWEDALRGRVLETDMRRALDMPRLFVLDRRRATLKNLETTIEEARKEFPGEPVLVGIDYAQLMESKEREVRQRVADVFAQIDDVAREKKVVTLALSQMSRASAGRARKGEALGAETAELGAETAAIERFATVTMAIGFAAEREDGTSAVELSIGKWRMGKGDKVIPMNNEGRSGRWRIAGEAKTATEVRDTRETEKTAKLEIALELQIVGFASKAVAAFSRNDLDAALSVNRRKLQKAVGSLLASGQLVEIARHATRSKSWLLWTEDRARAAGAPLVRDSLFGGGQ